MIKQLKEGRENANGGARPGRPRTLTIAENIEAMKKMILDNRRITIRAVVDDLDITFRSCRAIFTHFLCMKCAAAKIAKF